MLQTNEAYRGNEAWHNRKGGGRGRGWGPPTTFKSAISLTIGPCNKYKQETAGKLYFGFQAIAMKVGTRASSQNAKHC